MAVLALALVACGRDEEAGRSDTAVQAPPRPQEAPLPEPPEQAGPTLEDVIEHTPRYVVGISYPSEAKRYPELAEAMHAYAQAAREELTAAAASAGDAPGGVPYDLSLEFRVVAETPRVVAVAADGSSYTGGAHGNPLVTRFVWLPEREELLHADALIPSPDGWRDVSRYVREQLYAQVSQRIDADELEPDARREQMRSAARMIDEGSAPEPDNFDLFEPLVADDGRIQALRFVFPPYQVGPYADGTQTIVVPAAVLLAHVAEPYRDLFAPTPPAPDLGEMPEPVPDPGAGWR